MPPHNQTLPFAVAIGAAIRIPLLSGLPETLDAGV